MSTASIWKAILSFLIQNSGIIGALIGWPLVTAFFTTMSRRGTPEEWEAWALKSPVLAFLVEVMRAWGLDPFAIVRAFYHYAQRKSGKIPEGAIRVSSLPEPIKAFLSDPQKTEELLALLASIKAPETATPPKPVEPTGA